MTSPIVEAGVVYATFDGDGVYALDAATGSMKWFYPWPSSNLLLASPIEANGTVIVPVYAQGVIAFDAQNGGLKWKYDVASHFAFHPGAVGEVAAGAGMAFVPFYDFSDDQRSRYRVTLVAFNPNDGQVIWQTLLQDFAFEEGFAGRTYLAFANKTVYTTGPYHDLNGTEPGDGPIIALDAQTGALKWSTSVARPYSRIIVTSDMLLVLSDTSPVHPPGSRCDNCTVNLVVALNSTNGAIEWVYRMDALFDPVLAEDALYTTQILSISSLSGTTPLREISASATIFLALLLGVVAIRYPRRHQVRLHPCDCFS